MNHSRDDIKLISFDLDNTLYDNTPVLSRAESIIESYLEDKFNEQNQPFDYENYLAVRKNLLSKNDPAFDDVTLLRKTALESFCGALKNNTEIIDEALDVFMQARSEIDMPQVIQGMLLGLSKDYMLVTITNGNCDIQKHSIATAFKKHYSPSMGYRAKPHPKMLNQVMADFDIQPNQMLHIGDSIEMDGGGAINAGVNFYHFAPFNVSTNLEDCCCQLVQFVTSSNG
jgi:putative hydrolase of the HAD superfamily